MVYMGSKNRYVKYIIPKIQKYIDDNNITIFIDCFCGGASITDQINCTRVFANDLSPTLIALHKQAQKDFSKIPEDCTREDWDNCYSEWKKIRLDKDYNPSISLYKIGAVEWYGSFLRGGFPRGYAKPSATRNYYQEGRRNHEKQAKKESYKKIIFTNVDYHDIFYNIKDLDLSKTLLYCDAPYKGTKPYGISPKFDYEQYYDWLRQMSKTVPIFISEQEMPEDFPLIWEKDVVRATNKENNFKACEKLYFIDNR